MAVGAARPRRVKASKFRTPRFTRTVSQWLNLLIETGFALERVEEPRPSDETVPNAICADAQVVATSSSPSAKRNHEGGIEKASCVRFDAASAASLWHDHGVAIIFKHTALSGVASGEEFLQTRPRLPVSRRRL